jgi:glycosyltransferase involved in cell wall biosynthesis
MRVAPVSVVMPAYNCGRWIGEALESVRRQTLPPRQIIVVDDGSTDDTLERVRPFAQHVEYVRQANAGVSAARNIGVRAAREPFIAFLDADDVWHPRKLELQMEVFRRHEHVGILSTPTFDWPARTMPRFPEVPPLSVREVTWEQMVVKNRMNTSSIALRRDAIRCVDPFDTAMQGPEDRDMWLRILEVTYGAVLDLPLSGYRVTPGGISQNAAKCRDGMLRILAKLDERDAWRGRWWLRRKAYSYVNHACAWLYTASGQQRKALDVSLRSLVWYPLPYSRADVEQPLERVKRTMVIAMRLMHLKAQALPTKTDTSEAPGLGNVGQPMATMV